MSEKVSTISARFSKPQIDMLDRLQTELALSKTDVLQLAVEHLGTTKVISPENRMEIPVSQETLRRASNLHGHYGYKTTLEALLSEAVEVGVREIRKRLKEDRAEDADLARVDMDARAIEMQQDSMVQ
ncbi:MAG: hypothetical protein U9R75_02660 [Candidatus Thermoplasmatota archaeon]|nr:hypothetical protein [Candidatus Thermoplasmatota archaeon]